MALYPKYVQRLINSLQQLSSVGRKTAVRFAFDILAWNQSQKNELKNILDELDSIERCAICGALQDSYCRFCADMNRDQSVICVVASLKDLFAVEETASFRGLYHVLGSLLSPLDGCGDLQLDSLYDRLEKNQVKEIILALGSTLEGDATALFIKEKIDKFKLKISRLSFGLPMGTALEYADGSSLSKAIADRQSL